MPTFRQSFGILARGAKVFFGLAADVVREMTGFGREGRRFTPVPCVAGNQTNEVERLRRLLAEKERQISSLRTKKDGSKGVRPENIIWIFGTGRSGNTWFSSMMGDMGHAVWREPSIGKLFGEFYYFDSREGQRGTSNFVLGEKQRGTWVRSIRNFVLEGANGRFPHLEDRCLVIKEQVGSVGAPLMMEALPESRMILLVRDPRDVVASWVNATRKGGWRYERLSKGDQEWRSLADEAPDVFIEERATHYLKNVSKAKQAYEEHHGPKVSVRYEDLRADTMGTMRRVYSQLGVKVDEKDLAQAVKKHAWESVPEGNKGEGKFHRKATPGGWQEDLTPEQAEKVERITAPLLKEFYPG